MTHRGEAKAKMIDTWSWRLDRGITTADRLPNHQRRLTRSMALLTMKVQLKARFTCLELRPSTLGGLSRAVTKKHFSSLFIYCFSLASLLAFCFLFSAMQIRGNFLINYCRIAF